MTTLSPASDRLLELQPIPTLLRRMHDEFAQTFRRDVPTRISRAPGRLDVMGGIADYTGSLVCEMPIGQAASVALQENDSRVIRVCSLNLKDASLPNVYEIGLDQFNGFSLAELKSHLADSPCGDWVGYIVGCLFLLRSRGHIDQPITTGLSLCVYSDVPFGAGVSSSAAIEVATMLNLVAHFGVTGFNSLTLAKLCQDVENQVVGAPCGVMDQVSSCAGEAGQLLRLVCQPHELLPPLKLPDGVRVVGINSNVKHSVGGGAYGRTRCAAFMGLRIIEGLLQSDSTNWVAKLNGYLANLPADLYRGKLRSKLPTSIAGSDFIKRYGNTRDQATSVDPATTYAVQAATDHHVFEAARVPHFCQLIEAAAITTDVTEQNRLLSDAGDLMHESHDSYGRNAQLGAAECDLLVELLLAQRSAGVFGAKITGGGSGGTVAVLCREGAAVDAAIQIVLQQYQSRTGLVPQLISGTSPGGWRAGTVVI